MVIGINGASYINKVHGEQGILKLKRKKLCLSMLTKFTKILQCFFDSNHMIVNTNGILVLMGKI